MDCVGKIDRRGPARENDDIAHWGKAKNLIGIHFEFGMLEEIIRIGCLVQYFKEFSHPTEFSTRSNVGSLFVMPMGCHAILGNLVHFLGTDLNFNSMTVRSDNGRVQGFIAIGFWRADKVFDSAGNDVVGGMNDAEGPIALLQILNNDAERDDVCYLLKRNVFFCVLRHIEYGVFSRPVTEALKFSASVLRSSSTMDATLSLALIPQEL